MENQPQEKIKSDDWKKHLCTVTPFSKYLALALFVALPFIGFWLGLRYVTYDENNIPIPFLIEFNKHNIVVEGEPTYTTYTMSHDFSKLPDALLVENCLKGGYDIAGWEGEEVMLTSYPITERYQNEPLNVYVMTVGDKELCVYKSVREGSVVAPGIFPASSKDFNDEEEVQKLQFCPDEWISNEEPCVYVISPNECNNPSREYFIVDAVRREVSEFDINWVTENCELEVQRVY